MTRTSCVTLWEFTEVIDAVNEFVKGVSKQCTQKVEHCNAAITLCNCVSFGLRSDSAEVACHFAN